MESYEIMKKAIGTVGAKSVAADMNLSTSLIYKWCQPHDSRGGSGAENPLDRIAAVCDLTDDIAPVSWLCQQAGGYFVKNPDEETVVRQPLIKVTQGILKEFSDLLDVVSQSIEDDGQVDSAESARIRKEWEELKAVTEGFVNACEKGTYLPKTHL